MKYYECKKCGCIVELVRQGDENAECECGESLRELKTNVTEASQEKHIPVAKEEGNTVVVTVAEQEHPMNDEHYIGWVAICTDKGTQRRPLYPSEPPVVKFALTEGEKLREVYAFCNKHGLWRRKFG